ncbi:MAG: TetR family transcriptional regulator [Alphaproteobacteria bacterium]|nr:TetR family transcriptional regulator [Alphaproteobacteria bacterium]
MAKRPRLSRPAAPASGPDAIVHAALALAARRPWRQVTMAEIAAEAGVGLAELHAAHPSKADILAAFMRRIDAQVLAGTDADAAGEPVHDRLMDVVLRRLDALKPYKEGIRSILRDGGGDPEAALCGAVQSLRSMAWMLEAAGIATGGLAGLIRVKGLAAIYAGTLWTWFRDDSEDAARTMAYLDRRLNQGARVLAALSRCPGQGARTRSAA